MSERTICIGDIHGCVEEFRDLVGEIQYDPSRDRLILLGDLFDRGPDPIGAVHLAQDLKAEVVQSNHDEKHVRYFKWVDKIKTGKHHGKNPVQLSADRIAVNDQLTDLDKAWLAGLPYTIRFKIGQRDWIAVHAGFVPGVPLEKQDPKKVIRTTMIDRSTGRMLSLNEMSDSQYDPIDWIATWKGPQSVVYGHHVYDLTGTLTVLARPDLDYTTIGTDTGCCFGGYLSAVVWKNDSSKLFPEHHKVKAREKYAERMGLT